MSRASTTPLNTLPGGVDGDAGEPRIVPASMSMNTLGIDALHDIHTVANDVLKGYGEMAARAQPEIQTVIQRLSDMHQRHASEQQAELVPLHDAGKDDTSLQGTVNKVVVILRDWLSELDGDVLPAVRQGEESLRDEYIKALEGLQSRDLPSVVALLRIQARWSHVYLVRLGQAQATPFFGIL